MALRRSKRSPTDTPDEVELKLIVGEFMKTLNGDHRVPTVQNYCWELGCCSGRQRSVAAERIADLCCKMWFNGISVDLPSATRWYSFLPHLARQCGAMMCHQLLARVLTKAYGNDLDPAANQAEEGSFHVTAHQRKTTSLDFVNNQPASAQAVGVALLCSQPIEDLSYRLQSVDHTGGSIIELTDTRDTGLLISVQRSFWDTVNSWHADAGRGKYFESFLWHMDGFGADRSAVLNEVRSTCLSMAAGVWNRLELRRSCVPERSDPSFARSLLCPPFPTTQVFLPSPPFPLPPYS